MGRFHVGDEVVVVDGVRECFWTPTAEMKRMIGAVVHIASADESSKVGCYRVREDPGRFNWCDKCFELFLDENEIPISDEEFDEILGSLLLGGDSDEV